MTALPHAQIERLARLLGMLGSDHMGERAAAGLKAHELVRRAGLTWPDVLQPKLVVARDERRPPGPGGWRELVSYCLQHADRISQWEASFLQSLLRFRRISPKQMGVLTSIAERISAGRADR